MGFDFINPFSICWLEDQDEESSPITSALQIPLIVARILSFLDVETIKISRGVCKIFEFEAAKHLSDRVSVRVVTSLLKHEPSLPDLASFLSRHKIQHCLNLSLVPLPIKKVVCIPAPDSENVVLKSQDLFEFLALIGYLVTELRLEFCLLTEEDAALFLKILGHLPHLVSLHLKLETYQIPGFLALDHQSTSSLTSVRSLILNFRTISAPWQTSTSSVPSLQKLLKLFPLLNHLDTSGCTYVTRPRLNTLREFCYFALLENPLCLPLTEITLDLQNQSEAEWDLLEQLPFQFQKLHLFVNAVHLDKVATFVSRHSSTLTNLQMSDTCCGFGRNSNGASPRIFEALSLPALTTLRVDSYRKTNFKSEQSGPGSMDLFGLRQLFLNGTFETAFRNLTSITVSFFMEFEESCWEYMFPEEDKDGTLLEICQLKRLSLTFAGDCDSPFVERLTRIFPNLVSLRHTKLEFPPTTKFLWCREKFGRLCQSQESCPDPDLPKVLKDPPPTLHGCEHVKSLGPEVVQLPFPASNFLRPFPCKFFRDKQLRRDISYYAILRPIWK